jgi:hypothetical protein
MNLLTSIKCCECECIFMVEFRIEIPKYGVTRNFAGNSFYSRVD